MKGELLPDRRQRFVLEEIAACIRRRGSTTGGRGSRSRRARSRHDRLFRAVEFGGGEAELRDTLQLAHQRFEAARDAVVRDERLEAGFVARPRDREQRATGGRSQKRGSLALRAARRAGRRASSANNWSVRMSR